MKNSTFRTRAMIIAAFGIVVNVVLGTVMIMVKSPILFLDTIGTIMVSVLLGPWYGVAVGALTNIIKSILVDPADFLFLIVNVVIAIIVGNIAHKFKFNYITAIVTGIILSIIAPLIGTPIAVYVYGGLTGSGMDIFVIWMKQSGQSIFQAAFLSRIISNVIDKVFSCVFVAFMLKRLPTNTFNIIGRDI